MRNLISALMIAAMAATAPIASAQTPAAPFDNAARQDIVAKAGAALTTNYIFPDRADQAKAKIDAALAAGTYGSISDPNAFAARLTEDLQSVTHDRHMSVFYVGGLAAGVQHPLPPARPPTNGGFARVDRLKGNIGYIRLLGFPVPSVFSPVANDALHDLADTDALIIDMRDNGGGSAESDSYFGSFFFDPAKPVQLNSIIHRTPSTNEFTTTEFWTKPVSSPYLNKPVYILTSKRTFSGGEAFVYDLKVQKRAIIFGETTGGGANPGGIFPLGPRFTIFVPGGRAENPLTKTNWEGTGVSPDQPMDAKVAFQAAMSDAVTQLLKKKINDPALAALKTDLARQTEPGPLVEASFLKFRTTASPGTEAALRRHIEGLIKAQPPFDEMSPGLADAVRQQMPTMQPMLQKYGALKSITFTGVGPAGADIYEVDFENAKTEWRIFPLTDGKIDVMNFRPLP
jgi:Peptidase family S41/N-terminal domain of Peptidase_S41 in eukaryotic IRBP